MAEKEQAFTNSLPETTKDNKKLSELWRKARTHIHNMMPSFRVIESPSRRKFMLETVPGLTAATALAAYIGREKSIRTQEMAHRIDLGNKDIFPTECPPQIEKVSNGVLHALLHERDALGEGTTESLSAVLIDDRLALSSGHGIRSLLSGQVKNKEGIDIESGEIVGMSTDGAIIQKQITRTASVLTSLQNGNRDIALWEIDSPILELPRIKISQNQPQIGDPLFFVDYGPDGENNKRMRDPRATDTQFRQSAIYLGALVGFDSNHQPIVLTFRNLGKGDQEQEFRFGSSGGAVLNTDGNLVGAIKSFHITPESTGDIEDALNINLTNMDPKERASRHRLGVYEPITEQDIAELRERLKLLPTSGKERWNAPTHTSAASTTTTEK